MTIRCVERESGKEVDIPSGRKVCPKGQVNFGRDKLYNYLPIPILASLPTGQGYRVEFGEESLLNFCVWPGRNGSVQTETTLYKAT